MLNTLRVYERRRHSLIWLIMLATHSYLIGSDVSDSLIGLDMGFAGLSLVMLVRDLIARPVRLLLAIRNGNGEAVWEPCPWADP